MLEMIIEKILYASRWILAPLYLCMSVVLLALSVVFFKELIHLIVSLEKLSETDFILLALGLIDMLLVGGLIVMVMFASYENFVSKIDKAGEVEKLGWLGRLDAGTLKLKLSASIVAISAIFLLKKYVQAEQILQKLPNDASLSQNPLFWYTVIHLVFVVSALLLGLLDRISFAKHRKQ